MGSIFPEVARRAFAGEGIDDALLDRAVAAAESPEGSREFFGTVVEPLADAFDARLCDVYAQLFGRVLQRVSPGLPVRARGANPPAPRNVARVFVVSRVTLGADIAVTSVVLDGAKQAFPDAGIVFVGNAKNHELFAEDRRIAFAEAPYDRTGTLRGRIEASRRVREIVDQAGAIVIDPDSRLTQLGLVPVCDPARYFFFESRSWGGETPEPLSALTSRWMWETFGVRDARSYLAPLPATAERADVAVSLGVGENPAKGLGPEFERELLRRLAGLGVSLLVDEGAGGEEAGRVRAALPAGARTFRGSFAAFANHIARSRCYAGYDSVGQHAAAALGVPLVTVFQGFPNERFFARWRPAGRGPVTVVRGDARDPLAEALAAAERYLRASTITSPQ